ncbi:hypothetical protein DdX_17258 [Ditylenchus destructor]|uniref:Uncharacterized protein n=1 Tax=Ditylenchus destructor TaxID=166010 RepID=A0AAD4MMI3_9BILA|nr:hypothetical protein DdX_17258 [Ditylenchus destructor]
MWSAGVFVVIYYFCGNTVALLQPENIAWHDFGKDDNGFATILYTSHAPDRQVTQETSQIYQSTKGTDGYWTRVQVKHRPNEWHLIPHTADVIEHLKATDSKTQEFAQKLWSGKMAY